MSERHDTVPRSRVRAVNRGEVAGDGRFVTYWMIAARRTRRNHALQRAVDWARRLRRPLLVLEPLRCDYRWAADRFHRPVIEGMIDNARALADTPARYVPYVEPRPGAGRGLLESVARHSSVVVTDDHPGFFLPRAVAAAGRRLEVRLEAVDSNGLLPLHATPRVFPTAHSFRRHLQRELADHLDGPPRVDPLRGVSLPRARLPRDVSDRFPPLDVARLDGRPAALSALTAGLPIDHRVPAVERRGGPSAAARRLRRFVRERLEHYHERRNLPGERGTSGLSPDLHFGHLSVWDVLAAIARREGWRPAKVRGARATGSREGWWGMSPAAEAFLDELVTWRELGFHTAAKWEDYREYDSLPPWALETLASHAGDRRPFLYTLEQFQQSRTHDPLWNAAQRQLVREGTIHNYLRMLWGKKILEWTANPRQALEVMVELNNRWALDGRDPNSYSGIFWVLGRYDRAWGPERPIFGKVRYMSSANTARKLPVGEYLERYGGD